MESKEVESAIYWYFVVGGTIAGMLMILALISMEWKPSGFFRNTAI